MPTKQLFCLKQFSLCQAHTAMKLGTDAFALGAWTASSVVLRDHAKILDIGTGTGILSLMLAQRFPSAEIDALEIDTGAAHDAVQNFSKSPWAKQLNLFIIDALSFETNKLYDLIISNPPFFESVGLSASSVSRSLARQEQPDGLNIRTLIAKAKNLLTPQGALYLILPYEREAYLRQIACEELMYINKLCRFYSKPNTPVRTLVCLTPLLMGHEYRATDISCITQREETGDYTCQWRNLLTPYISLSKR